MNIKYLALNGKTQIITPTLLGELIFDVVNSSIRQLLNPELTASWEKGLTYVAEGTITPDEYMEKLEHFVAGRTYGVLKLNNQYQLRGFLKRQGKIIKNRGDNEMKKESMKTTDLFSLEHTMAKSLLEKYEYPWEALAHIEEFVMKLGASLPEDEYMNPAKASGFTEAPRSRRRQGSSDRSSSDRRRRSATALISAVR